MPLAHTYISLCTVHLRRRVVNLASPFHLQNASCTALHMHCTVTFFAMHPLAPLSTWTLVHPASRHLVDNVTLAAGGVAASEWLAANLCGGVVAAGGTGSRTSANDDAQSDDEDDDPASVLEDILGRQVGQREDTDEVLPLINTLYY